MKQNFNSRRVFPAFVFGFGLVTVLSASAVLLLETTPVQAQSVTVGASSTAIVSPDVMEIVPAFLPDGTVGVSYSQTLTASTTDSGPFVWSISGGALPTGLVLSSSTGTNGMSATISGMPTTSGQQFTFSVSATDYMVASTQTYVMNINPNTSPAATTTVTTVSSSNSVTASVDLAAELNTLESEVLQLESLAGMSSAGTQAVTTTICNQGTFCRDLTVGDSGPDVMMLQQFLNGAGFPIASSGPGSPGNETEYFGTLTEAALAKWQSANGISPAAGYFGPTTRVAIEAQMTNSSSSSSDSSVPMISAPSSTSY